ncbi:MAG: YncE family protein [Candidatus Bathyarchaeota archaeon]|nr:YncE family protein [Candidatus Bathyarchaeota archaeon]
MEGKHSPSGYHLNKKRLIGGEGGWDYLVVDDAARRLYVTHNDRVHVLNADTLDPVGEVLKTEGVHGVAIASEFRRGFASNGRASTVSIFDLGTLKVIKEVAVGRNPDAIRFDPFSKRVFVFNGVSHDASVIDAATGEVIATIPLGGKPEFSVADGLGHVYVNNEDTSEVMVIDSKTLVLSRWPIAPGESPTGLAIDLKNRRLFSVTRNKFMIMLDADDGHVVASLPIGGGCDGCMFDPDRKLVFSSNGEGTLTIVREESPTTFSVLDTVDTKRGARTMTIDLRTHALFPPAADYGPTPQPTVEQPKPRPPILPNTFVILQLQK